MYQLNVVRLLLVPAILVLQLQTLYHAQGVFHANRHRERWFIFTALVNTLCLLLLLWYSVSISTVYCVLLLLYCGEFALLFRPDFTGLVLMGGLFPFVLLCVRGVMIPLFALLNHIDMFELVRNSYQYNLSLFWSVILCCGVLLLFRIGFPDDRLRLLLGCRNQKRLACTSLCILLAYLILETYVYYYDFPQMWAAAFHLLTSVVAFASFAVVLWYAIDISAYIEYELKTRQVEKQLQRQVVHYQQYTRYVSEMRAFKHDYKHMMETVRHLVAIDAKEQACALLGQVSDQMENALQYTQYSNNMVVDAILQECAGRCGELGISFTAVVNLPDSIGLSELMLCRLFGNLADNAFEACAGMEGGERFIEIQSAIRGSWVTVELCNSFSGEIALCDGLPVSRKTDTNSHGLGLLSVRNIAESTGGFIKIEIDSARHVFCIHLHLAGEAGEAMDAMDAGKK